MARVKKLWLIKKEVIAYSLHEALRSKGKVYEVSLTPEKDWPQDPVKVGFTHGKEKTKN